MLDGGSSFIHYPTKKGAVAPIYRLSLLQRDIDFAAKILKISHLCKFKFQICTRLSKVNLNINFIRY